MADRVPFHAHPDDFGGLGHLLTPEVRRGGPDAEHPRGIVADYLEDQEPYSDDPEGVRRQKELLRGGGHVVVDDAGRVRPGRWTVGPTIRAAQAVQEHLYNTAGIEHDADFYFDHGGIRNNRRTGDIRLIHINPEAEGEEPDSPEPVVGRTHARHLPANLAAILQDAANDNEYENGVGDPDDVAEYRRLRSALLNAPVEEVDRDHPSERSAPERLARATAAVLRKAREADAPPKKKYGCLMLPVTGKAADAALAMGKAIPEGDLGTDGRESFVHLTALHGFHDEVGPDDVRKVLVDFGPVKYRFGELSAFYGKDTGKEYDVLKVAVESDDLRRLHDALKKLPNTQKFDSFKPHMTIAYLRAGLADKYIEELGGDAKGLPGGEATEAVFSDAKKNRTTLPIGGGETAEKKSRSAHAARLRRAGEPVRKSFAGSDEPALHAAMAAGGGREHTPALVYADWLDDSGKPAHAWVIREAHRQHQSRTAAGANGFYDPQYDHFHQNFPAGTDYVPPGGTWATTYPLTNRPWQPDEHWIGLGLRYAHDPDTGTSFGLTVPAGDRDGLLRSLRAEGARLTDDMNKSIPEEKAADEPQRYAAYRAPAGGAVVRGVYYVGGRMIPDLTRFLPGMRKAVAGRKAKAKKPAPESPLIVGYGPQAKLSRLAAGLRRLRRGGSPVRKAEGEFGSLEGNDAHAVKHLLGTEDRLPSERASTNRLVTADQLEDAGRYGEAELLRNPRQHVVVDDQGRVRAGRLAARHVQTAYNRLRGHLREWSNGEFFAPDLLFWGQSRAGNDTGRYELRTPGPGGRDSTVLVPYHQLGRTAADFIDRHYNESNDHWAEPVHPADGDYDWYREQEAEYQRLLDAVRNAPWEEVNPDHPLERWGKHAQ